MTELIVKGNNIAIHLCESVCIHIPAEIVS